MQSEKFSSAVREIEIIQRTEEGKTSSVIANVLFFHKLTVNIHRQNILEKREWINWKIRRPKDDSF
ncbi:MAG: LuxR C-terminal-related transcriptional regulator [Bacteroidota bacterium]|nr:LuxR C-terminal-related transcriptional regulator [Bacteroidota bacterium]